MTGGYYMLLLFLRCLAFSKRIPGCRFQLLGSDLLLKAERLDTVGGGTSHLVRCDMGPWGSEQWHLPYAADCSSMMQYAGMHFIFGNKHVRPIRCSVSWGCHGTTIRCFFDCKPKKEQLPKWNLYFDGWRISARAQARQSDWQMEWAFGFSRLTISTFGLAARSKCKRLCWHFGRCISFPHPRSLVASTPASSTKRKPCSRSLPALSATHWLPEFSVTFSMPKEHPHCFAFCCQDSYRLLCCLASKNSLQIEPVSPVRIRSHHLTKNAQSDVWGIDRPGFRNCRSPGSKSGEWRPTIVLQSCATQSQHGRQNRVFPWWAMWAQVSRN